MLSTSTAYAAPGTGAAAVTGSGTIAPGLTALPTPQAVAFSGTAIGGFANTAPAADAGMANCHFSGSSNTLPGDNYAVGMGTVSGTCNGAGIVTGTGITLNCNAMIYVRVGTVVIVVSVNCSATVSGTTSNGAALGAFNFIPTDADDPNITSYMLTGAAAFAGV